MRILLVDDEVEFTDSLTEILRREGYEVDVAGNGTLGLQLAREKAYDLLVLDWMMPQLSGLSLCQQLRDRGSAAPILFLTAKDTIDDRVIGLDAGADDYLVKPFELRELLARVRALLRRGGEQNPLREGRQKLKVGDLELDRDNQLAYRNRRAIELSEKETQLLAYFLEHPGQLLDRDRIYQHLWKEVALPSSNVLAALVRLLRRKIEQKGEAPLIHTVYGKGYRFGTND